MVAIQQKQEYRRFFKNDGIWGDRGEFMVRGLSGRVLCNFVVDVPLWHIPLAAPSSEASPCHL
jgi:hypothetical protein